MVILRLSLSGRAGVRDGSFSEGVGQGVRGKSPCGGTNVLIRQVHIGVVVRSCWNRLSAAAMDCRSGSVLQCSRLRAAGGSVNLNSD